MSLRLNNLLKALIFLWLGARILFGLTMLIGTPKQIKKDKLFIEYEIKPAVDFVKNYKAAYHTLPTIETFDNWETQY